MTHYPFQLISDLHVQSGEYEWSRYVTKQSGVETLVVLGDVMRLVDYNAYLHVMRGFCENFETVYLVPGNHEFYIDATDRVNTHNNLVQRLYELEHTLTNLTLLYNRHVDLPGNIRLYGTILWCNVPIDENYLTLPIKKNDGDWVDGHWLSEQNDIDVAKLELVIKQAKVDGKRLVVASHYPPSEQCLVEKYKTSDLRHYYSNNLYSMLCKESVYVWMYGHTHDSMDFRTEGDCRVVSNQVGRRDGWVGAKVVWVKNME